MRLKLASISVPVNPILALRMLSPRDRYATRHGLEALAVKVRKHLSGQRDVIALISIDAFQTAKRRAGSPESLL